MRRWLFVVFSFFCSILNGWALADGFEDAVRRDTKWLSHYASRVPGTPSHAAAQKSLLEKVEAVDGARVVTQSFELTMPVVKRCDMQIHSGAGQGTHQLYPLWPDMVRLNTTPAEGVRAELHYVGEGALTEIPARSLNGKIAVMEMSAYENWKRPCDAGAAALILLGSDRDHVEPPARQSLCKPRYYLPDGKLADALRGDAGQEVSLFCDAEWKAATGKNIYALVLPDDLNATTNASLAFAAAYDSMSLVMGQAPGADAAIDAAFLLNLLRRTASRGVDRPLLFCFLDGYAVNQRGMREALLFLTAVKTVKTEDGDSVVWEDASRKEYEELEQEQIEHYQEIADQVKALGEGREALSQLWDRMQYRELQRYVKDTVAHELMALREVNGRLRLDIHDRELAIENAKDEPISEQELAAVRRAHASLSARLVVSEARTRRINQLLGQILKKQPVEDEFLDEALAVWEEVKSRALTQLQEARRFGGRFERMDQLRETLFEDVAYRDPFGVPVSFLIGIDLSDSASSFGFGHFCNHLRNDETAHGDVLSEWLKVLLKTPDEPFWREHPVMNAESVLNHEDGRSFNASPVSLLTSPAASYLLPAATLMTVDGVRTRVDTPQDRYDRLKWDRVGPQVELLKVLLTKLTRDRAFPPPARAYSTRSSHWRHAKGSIVTESVAETVPRTPAVGMLVALELQTVNVDTVPGVRRHEFVMTGRDGGFIFPALPGHARFIAGKKVKGYRLDERGNIVMAISDSASMIAGRIATHLNVNQAADASPARAVAFDCVELNGPEFFDPRFLEPLSEFTLLDVTYGGTPKRFSFSVFEGQMLGLLQSNTTWQLLLRAGNAGNRLALLNLDPAFVENADLSLRDAMKDGGFSLENGLYALPSHLSARDFYLINDWRMRRFRDAGISSQVIDDLHKRTTTLLESVDDAIETDDGSEYERLSATALANEIRTYEAVNAMGSDVTRGAIFLMILLVPFSVAMERLLLACRRIGRRISAGIGIFFLMTVVLWSFHPSFKITTQPMIIVMAFAILILSLVVIVMILRKFESDMEALRRGRAEASGAETSRGGLIGSAVWLGIANMRKRKVRTTLTATTIVLITFALLCFSSSTEYKNRRQYALSDVKAPYAGVLIRQPNMNPMHERAFDTVQNLVGENMPLVPRYWISDYQPTWRIHVRNAKTGDQVSLKVALGLSQKEERLTRPSRLLKQWQRLGDGEGCYLSASVAERLNVEPGDHVVFGGFSLELLDTFSAVEMEEGLRMMDGTSILPYDYTVESEDRADAAATQTQLMKGVGLAPELNVTYVQGNDCIIIDADLARKMGGELRSMAMRCASREAAEATALDLMNVLAFPMYYGAGDDVKVVVSTPLVPKPPRSLLIPLIISALIIFNTMLNSVSERKREIHIYTSLGLAPRHVGVLFMAESATYGLMGSVFGYVVGQGLAKVLTHFDLMGGITLNYSGTNVILTMGMVMAVVLLSSLVPAMMAGKLATPSEDMKWRVSAPEDGTIAEMLPFTVTRSAAGGLIAFVKEFLEAHQDGGIGGFTTDEIELLPPSNSYVAGVKSLTWLAPYDLGVRQTIQIEVHEDVDEICNIKVFITYGSGQVKTWWRLNRAFLDELRRQLLGWRKVKPERMMTYIQQAKRS